MKPITSKKICTFEWFIYSAFIQHKLYWACCVEGIRKIKAWCHHLRLGFALFCVWLNYATFLHLFWKRQLLWELGEGMDVGWGTSTVPKWGWGWVSPAPTEFSRCFCTFVTDDSTDASRDRSPQLHKEFLKEHLLYFFFPMLGSCVRWWAPPDKRRKV